MSTLKLDRFDTPSNLADRLLAALSSTSPSRVVDFAAGGGALIEAAIRRWPLIECWAFDVDENTVRSLRRRRPKWRIGLADFLNLASHNRGKLRSLSNHKAELIVLNPPFSVRGNHRVVICVGTLTFRCSPAMAFLIRSTAYLSKNGSIATVMPAGSLDSQRDRGAWIFLKSKYHVQFVGEQDRSTFAGAHASTVLIVLRDLQSSGTLDVELRIKARHSKSLPDVKLRRGWFQMHNYKNAAAACRTKTIPLIHSTDLRENAVLFGARTVRKQRATITGPAILLSRVGMPSREKIAILGDRNEVVLSDCILAIFCNSATSANAIQRLLVKNWKQLERLYGGTCAKYLTLARLRSYLENLGTRCELAMPQNANGFVYDVKSDTLHTPVPPINCLDYP